MPGQYYAYLPFDNNDDLLKGVRQWQNAFSAARGFTTQLEQQKEKFEAESRKIEAGQMFKDERTVTPGALERLQNLVDDEPDLRKRPKVFTFGEGMLGTLSGLDPDDYTLYIVGHCTQGSNTVRNLNMRVRGFEERTASELVSRMRRDGLPRGIKNIKLLACYGAAPSVGNAPFAETLLTELSGHCNNFKLRAYLQPVLLSHFYKDKDTGKTWAKYDRDKPLHEQEITVGGNLADVKVDYAHKNPKLCGCCQTPATKFCSRCRTQYYCNQDCQRSHWKEHKTVCAEA